MPFINTYSHVYPQKDDLDMIIAVEVTDTSGNKFFEYVPIRVLLEQGRVKDFQKWWVREIYKDLGVPRDRELEEKDVIILLDFWKMSKDSGRYSPPTVAHNQDPLRDFSKEYRIMDNSQGI